MVAHSPLLIRADASTEIGTGHIMRCLALGQHVQEQDVEVVFACAALPGSLHERLKNEGMSVQPISVPSGSAEDARQTVDQAKKLGSGWVVLDGYSFGSDYQRRIKESNLRLLAWDDYGHAEHCYADLVLNQNISADASLYESREPHTRLLLGTQYAVLRREFRERQDVRGGEQPDVARRLLITLGGSDPNNVTGIVLEALEALEVSKLEVQVVVGGANPHQEVIQEAARKGHHDITVRRDVQEMADLMDWADVAVSAGGSTCWELAFMGVPNLIIVMADNQRSIAHGLHEAGPSVNVGWHQDVTVRGLSTQLNELLRDHERRVAMVRKGQQVIDGQGGARILQSLLKKVAVELRPVQNRDSRFLWNLANDPVVRAASFHSEPIPWSEHTRWLASRVEDNDCLMLVGVDLEGSPMGQIRFDIEGGEANISISLARESRGHGHGVQFIKRGSARLFRERKGVKAIHAFIKRGNLGSLRAFHKARYKRVGAVKKEGHEAAHYVLTRSGT